MPTASGVLDIDYPDERYHDRAATHMSRRRLRKVSTATSKGKAPASS